MLRIMLFDLLEISGLGAFVVAIALVARGVGAAPV